MRFTRPMTRLQIATGCRVWRHDGGRSTTEGNLELTADGDLRFRVDHDVVWTVSASDVKAKSPWYSLGASLKVSAPSEASGLYMAYPPRHRGAVINSVDTAAGRKSLKAFKDRLAKV